ncbi:MAG: hypothetical protein WA655_20525 [Candidatus Korobacteraceae bacterium]
MKRGSLVRILCAVILVTNSFAARKKFDSSLPSTDISAPSNRMYASLSNSRNSSSSLILGGPGTPDSWNGGSGNWSNPGNWNNGTPGASSDVTIYSGGSDYVTLDTSPTINSLTIGGAPNGTQSELTDGGITQTLTITNDLTINRTGSLSLTRGSIVSVGTDSTNTGSIQLSNGSTLSINGTLSNAESLSTGYIGGGSGGNIVNIIGALTNAGSIVMYGSGDVATVGGLSNSGVVDVDGSTLQINGDVNNLAGTIITGLRGGSGSVLNIAGDLNNSGDFFLSGKGSTATIRGDVINTAGTVGIDYSGGIELENGSALTINGNVIKPGEMGANFNSGFGGNTLNITGTLTNESAFELEAFGDAATIGGLTNSVNALVKIESGSTLQINGAVDNYGTINIDSLSKFMVGIGNPAGLGYIQLANGTLGEIISATNFGVINVNGSALLAGTLDILLQGGMSSGYLQTVSCRGDAEAVQFCSIIANGHSQTFSAVETAWRREVDSNFEYSFGLCANVPCVSELYPVSFWKRALQRNNLGSTT